MIFDTIRNRIAVTVAFFLIAFVAARPANAAIIDAPPLVVESLTHFYSPPILFLPEGTGERIEAGDYSGFGPFSVPAINYGDVVRVRIEAAAGKKFVILDPDAQISFGLQWLTFVADGGQLEAGTVSFENLLGPAPTLTSSDLSVSTDAQRILAVGTFQSPVGAIEFTAINFDITVLGSPAAGPRDFLTPEVPEFVAIRFDGGNHAVMALVPEPGAATLLALAGLHFMHRRRR